MLAVSEVTAGFGLALAAAGCYELSYAGQALEARATDVGQARRPSLLLTLARRPLWAGAIALAIVAFGLQVGALHFAPLTLVQPTLALGLLLLLVLGVRVLGEPVGRREIAATLAVLVGVAGVALAAPERSDSVAGVVPVGAVLGALLLATLLPYLGAARPWRLAAGAGAADAFAGIAPKLISFELDRGRLLLALAWAAGAGVTTLIGLTSETSALQRLPATRVAPVVLVMQIGLPTLAAPLVARESWAGTPLGGAPLIVSLALLGVGVALLGTSVPVARLAARRQEAEHGGGR